MFYHGTSSIHLESILENGLIAGCNLTEDRKKNTNVVFLTVSYQSALGYAGRSKKMFGGERIILHIETKANAWKNRVGCTIYTKKRIESREIIEIIYPDKG
jgi:hypothetical protein